VAASTIMEKENFLQRNPGLRVGRNMARG